MIASIAICCICSKSAAKILALVAMVIGDGREVNFATHRLPGPAFFLVAREPNALWMSAKQKSFALQAIAEDVTRIIHELAEALTAIGNFVTVAARISDGADPIGIDIRKALEGVSGQHERAATALHQLRTRLLTRRKISITQIKNALDGN